MHEQDITLREQLEEMQRLTRETKTAAEAAQKSANALIEIERPWVQVLLTKIIVPGPNTTFKAFVYIWPSIGSVGRTPARTILIVFKADVLPKDPSSPPEVPPHLPDTPNYAGGSYIAKDCLIVAGTGIEPAPVEITFEDWKAVKARERFLYVYGYVRYVGVGDTDYETRFCQLYWVPYGKSDPSGEGFRMTSTIPDSYILIT
jgi:hypothetical protein